MIVFKSGLITEKSYIEILRSNSEQNPGYIIREISSKKIIYVKKRQQDMMAQYSTPFVGRIIFDQGYSTIKGVFIPAFQMIAFRAIILGVVFYCLASDFRTYRQITWNIGALISLVPLLFAEVAGIRKKRQIKCAIVHSIETIFYTEAFFKRKISGESIKKSGLIRSLALEVSLLGLSNDDSYLHTIFFFICCFQCHSTSMVWNCLFYGLCSYASGRWHYPY